MERAEENGFPGVETAGEQVVDFMEDVLHSEERAKNRESARERRALFSGSPSTDLDCYTDSDGSLSGEYSDGGAPPEENQGSGAPYHLFKVRNTNNCNRRRARRREEMVAMRKISRVLVEKLVEDLIVLIFKEAKMSYTQAQFQAYKKWLFDHLWVQAERLMCHMTPEKFINLHQTLYRELCHLRTIQFSPVTCVERAEPIFGNMAAVQFRTHMLSPTSLWVRVFGSRKAVNKIREETLRSEASPKPSSRPAMKRVLDPTTGMSGESLSSGSSSGAGRRQIEANQEECSSLVHQFLTAILRRLYEGAESDYTTMGFNTVYERLFDKLWKLCEGQNFTLRSVEVGELSSRTAQKMIEYSSRPKYVIMKGLSLKDPVIDDLIVRAFRKNMIGEKSRISKFFSQVLLGSSAQQQV